MQLKCPMSRAQRGLAIAPPADDFDAIDPPAFAE